MRVVVASESALEREQFRQAVMSLGLECAVSDCVGADKLPELLDSSRPGLILLAVGLDVASALKAVHRAASIGTTPIYAVCDGADKSDLPALLRAGLKGYLRKKELRGDLLSVVQQLRASGAIEVNWGRVIAVTAGLPGVGVTTVATNLAFALAENHPGRVALAQLTDGQPDLALNLDLTPAYPLAELAAGWYRLDCALMRRCLVDHPGGVSVLADQFGRDEPIEWQAAAMRQLLVLLRARFDFVVTDLGHALDSSRQEALRLADAVAVVHRLDVPALRIGREWLRRLQDLGIPTGRLLSVVNRAGQKEQMSWKTAKEALPVELGEAIPDDPARVNHALNAGKPLVQSARSAAITRSFAKLAARWQDASNSKSLARRLLAGAG